MAVVKITKPSNSAYSSAITLIIISLILYLLSPSSGLIKASDSSNADQPVVYNLTIKNGTLVDPNQSDIRVKVGTKDIIAVTTDRDGRLDMNGSDRDVFNPIFSGAVNSLGIPTDKQGSY